MSNFLKEALRILSFFPDGKFSIRLQGRDFISVEFRTGRPDVVASKTVGKIELKTSQANIDILTLNWLEDTVDQYIQEHASG